MEMCSTILHMEMAKNLSKSRQLMQRCLVLKQMALCGSAIMTLDNNIDVLVQSFKSVFLDYT